MVFAWLLCSRRPSLCLLQQHQWWRQKSDFDPKLSRFVIASLGRDHLPVFFQFVYNFRHLFAIYTRRLRHISWPYGFTYLLHSVQHFFLVLLHLLILLEIEFIYHPSISNPLLNVNRQRSFLEGISKHGIENDYGQDVKDTG